jgi:methionyl-tRNA formyltransferase
VLAPEKLDSAARDGVSKLGADALVCFSYGRIFGPKFLSLFPLGGINLHPSLLPLYRGATPVPEAILRGDTKTGVTVQKIALGMDSGAILARREVPLDGSETAGGLLKKLSPLGAELLAETLTFAFWNGAFPEGTPQDESQAVYCSKHEKEDGKIDWTRSAGEIDSRIRAFDPWPGSYTTEGGSRIRALRAAVVPPGALGDSLPQGQPPGTVLGTDGRYGILVQTGRGVLALQKLQRQAKNALEWRDFINGDRAFLEAVLGASEPDGPGGADENPGGAKKPGRRRPLASGIASYFRKLDENAGVFFLTALIFFILMAFAGGAVFFSVMQAPEQVLVPDVTGKELTAALVEMQEKELYPKIQLRYSSNPGDKGLILEQSPEAGTVVKAGRRVTLTVSRGVIVEKVGDYVGENIEDLRIRLQTLFSGSARPLIVLAQPLYTPNRAAAGTILEQDPLPDTPIADPVTVRLVVSRGPEYESARPPNLVGMSVNDTLQQLARTKLIFDFTARPADAGEKPGAVVSQEATPATVPNYSRIRAVFAFGPGERDTAAGLFTAQLPEYPYPVPMRLDAKTPQGNTFTILSFSHPGGNFTVPYSVPRGSELILFVAGREEVTRIAESRE